MADEEDVRDEIIDKLKEKGWEDDQIQSKPEWRVPDTPHDQTKRQKGQDFDTCGKCDIALFDNDSREYSSLRVIFELKEPTEEKGEAQLMDYLSSEPMAKMGFWTNGTDRLAVYKTLDGRDWIIDKSPSLPRPTDDLTQPNEDPLTWERLEEPTEAELLGAFKRLLNTVVANDTRATRREVQLRELLHLLLVKLDSDFQADGQPSEPVQFALKGSDQNEVSTTADHIRDLYEEFFERRGSEIFSEDDSPELQLDDETIHDAVVELAPYKLLFVQDEVVSKAFQVIRTKALKSGEGQFLTPNRIIRPCVEAMDIQPGDKVIDPACGTGGFLFESIRQVRKKYQENHTDEKANQLLTKWANENCYGVDVDDIGVKLTRALMLAAGDGSSHVYVGDSVSEHKWDDKYTHLISPLRDGQYTAVITNPPFGKGLKVKASECRKAGYSISRAASSRSKNWSKLEIGLLFLERSWRLLQVGGRLGIVLPETYFFSYSYRWLPDWLENRLELKGMLNIPMEAFQAFCRAKTNFYIFEKVGEGPEEEE